MNQKKYFTLLILTLLPLHLLSQPADNPKTFCNPLNLSYRFMVDAVDAREAADAVIVLFQDDYYLFASRSGGYWTSPDLRNWTLIVPEGIDIETYAPAVVAMRDSLFYLPSANGQIYKTGDPKSGLWQRGPTMQSYGDPDLFLDDDGRLYMYYGLSNTTPTAVVELDPFTFREISNRVTIVTAQASIHGWERRGDDNLLDESPWIEGSWMIKHNGTYYLTYAGPGTEFKTYADGVYVSDSPLGPFEYADYSPYAFKSTGFICGAGHGSTFQDKNGQYWHIGTMTISVNHMFERRLGLWPVDFDEDGHIHCNTVLGDLPQYLPGETENMIDNSFAGLLLLSHKKHVLASSSLEEHAVELAVDEESRTYWSAASGDKGEWLMLDLGKECSVEAIQVNFAEHNTNPALVRGRDNKIYQQYVIETSVDGKTFDMLVDKSNNLNDAPHDYIELAQAKAARYVKITNKYTPGNGFFALRDLRVFGNSTQATFTQVTDFTVDRSETDGRDATISWPPIDGADGYIVYYGIAPDKLYNNYMVYDAENISIHSLNHGVKYYFKVEAFDSGVEYYKPVGEIRSSQSGHWNDPDTWEQFDGESWIHPASGAPSINDGMITILGGHTITVAVSDSVDQLKISNEGELIVNHDIEFKIKDGIAADMLVEGTVINYGSIIGEENAEISFSGHGRYEHKQNGGSIPTAIWRANSRCIIDHVTDTAPENGNQNFYNVVWNCPGQTGNKSLKWNGNTIGGTIYIPNTGNGRWQMCAPATGESATVTIHGDIVQAGGEFSSNGTSNSETSIIIRQKGNVRVSGGNFAISRGSQSDTGTTLWYLLGDTVSIANATTQNSNKKGAKFIFAKQDSVQSLILHNVTYGGGGFPVEVADGAVLDVGTSVLGGNGDFILKPGATLYTGATNGIDAAIQSTGAQIFDEQANYGFNGSDPQVTGNLMPAIVAKLIVASKSSVTLSKSVTVKNAVEMADGALALGDNMLTFGPDASLIYAGTSAQTTSDAEFPETNGPQNLIVTNTRRVTLHASRSVRNLLVSCRFDVNDHLLTVDSAVNSDERAFVTMSEIGALRIRDVGQSESFFPVGTTTFTPVWVKNSGQVDDIRVSVVRDTKKADNGGRVNLLWHVAEDIDGGGDYTLKFGWMSSSEDAIFRDNRGRDARIFFMADTTERGSGDYHYNFYEQPFWVARSGYQKLGTFAVGNFRQGTGVLPTGAENPVECALQQNYPNPFNPVTNIGFSVNKESQVKLIVYDLLGQEVERLVDKRLKTGVYSIPWDAKKYASGTYLYKLTAKDFMQTRKMTFLK
ncbi:T9SS C-terminal target domain-containing protein [candidate division KSB1 bacterium]|nr:family 43 glycosylhydrolase [candidate division KSB1 bacterium]RQW00905.1 MAG: T9SS C-terminal target domain-containing protein [candidate division KSB1 bacterium]